VVGMAVVAMEEEATVVGMAVVAMEEEATVVGMAVVVVRQMLPRGILVRRVLCVACACLTMVSLFFFVISTIFIIHASH
jgi:hypothetical protein